MPTVEKVVVEFDVNDKELQQTVDLLEKSGTISKQNAAQFRKDSQTIQNAQKERNKLLEEEIEDLTELRRRRDQANDTKEVREYNARIRETETRIKALSNATKRQSESFLNMNNLLRNLGGTLAATFAVSRIKAFVDESTRLARELQGIETGFNKLNRPGLLNELQKATRGTVSNLELMRQAVRAENFQVPLEKLGTFFEFATARAIETGESVDFLVNSIIDGIGRKSTLVLDNLGISASRLQREIELVGDFGQAAANIIESELEAAGEVLDTDAIKAERFNTALENLQATIGNELSPSIAELQDQNAGWLETIDNLIQDNGILGGLTNILTGNIRALSRANDENRNSVDEHAIARAELRRMQEGNIEDDKEEVKTKKQLAKEAREAAKALREQFEAYVKNAEAIQELQFAEEQLSEVNKQIIEQAQQQTATINARAQAEIDASNRVNIIADQLLEDAEERDLKEAEQLDKSQQNIEDKLREFDEREKKRLQEKLAFERSIAAARADTALSLVELLGLAASQASGDQTAFLAFQKLAAIASITIDLQQEIAKNGATLGTPAAIPFNIQAAVRAALGIARVAATPIPQGFKEGVFDLKGPGTQTSDSIPAMLSKGETVFSAKKTREHYDLFKAISGNRYEEYISQQIMLPLIKKVKIESSKVDQFSDSNIVDSLYRNRVELKQITREIKKSNRFQLNTQ